MNEEIDCWLASYDANKIVTLRFPTSITRFLSLDVGYRIDPDGNDYVKWRVSRAYEAKTMLRKNGAGYALTRGSSTFQPALGYFGFSPCRAIPDGTGLMVELLERVTLGANRPENITPRPTSAYKYIEPIPKPQPAEKTERKLIDADFIKHLHTVLSQVEEIEKRTRYRLTFDTTSRRWVFSDIVY